MAEANILSGGIETLNEIRSSLVKLDGYRMRTVELADRQKKLEKELASKRRAMDAEIDSTLTKRRAEIQTSFDRQLEKTRERSKMVHSKRDKQKGSKVDERIRNESADTLREISEHRQEVRSICQQDRIPLIFNNGYFFSLFMFKSFRDYLIMILSALLILAIPTAVMFLVPGMLEGAAYIIIIMYVAVVLVTAGVYALIFAFVRNKHLDKLKEAREIRDTISKLKDQVRELEKSIRKDKDDSSYGLEEYDTEIGELDRQVTDIIEQQKQALKDFDNITRQDIINEIRTRYVDQMDKLQEDNAASYEEQRKVDEGIRTLTMDISRKYESYLGKGALSVQMIDTLIDIINAGDASNIADALAEYKRRTSESGRKPLGESLKKRSDNKKD